MHFISDQIVAQAQQCIRAPRVIVVTPHGRSGSYFLHSLLDGHPQIASFPFAFYTSPFPKTTGDLASNVRAWCQAFAPNFDHQTNSFLLGEDSDRVDLDQLAQCTLELIGDAPCTQLSILTALHLAFAHLQGRAIEHMDTVLIHMHHYVGKPDCHATLREQSSQFRFLGALRDPREACYSAVVLAEQQSKVRAGMASLKRAVDTTLKWYFGLEELLKVASPQEMMLVDLNALHKSGPQGIDHIASWAGLDLAPQLHESTFGGYGWSGNSISKESVDAAFTPSIKINRYPDRMPHAQQRLVEFFFQPLIETMGYAPIASPMSMQQAFALLQRNLRLQSDYAWGNALKAEWNQPETTLIARYPRRAQQLSPFALRSMNFGRKFAHLARHEVIDTFRTNRDPMRFYKLARLARGLTFNLPDTSLFCERP